MMYPERMLALLDREMWRIKMVMTERARLNPEHIQRLEQQFAAADQLRANYERDMFPDEGIAL